MFGRKIKHLLELRDMTQVDLIRATGLNKNLITDLVNDKRENTTTDTIKKIAAALRVSPTYFFEENAYTPLETLDLPEHIQNFIKNLDSMDYLILANDFKDKKISPELLKKIVATYEEVMNTK